ncbi:MAG: hypothetical protein K0S65_4034, partial [Labilithrix sp.]|nr:hypothetical protein [Labilithrix sp.]
MSQKSFVILGVVAGFALSGGGIAACSNRDGGFAEPKGVFDPDSGVPTGDCLFQCSLDGRSVIRSCTGEIVETCSAELACGAGLCQEPCAAAAADHSSNGCAFYFQPARFTKSLNQGCFVAYVVNTSTQPIDIALELEGQSLDISKSLYRATSGDPTWVPHVGPLAVGESAVLFISDHAPEAQLPWPDEDSPCPDGVVPVTYADTLPEGTGIGTSFHLTTSSPVNLSTMYPFGGARAWTSTATLLLPVATWGTQHIIVNAWEAPQYLPGPGGPAAQIVASEDDTEITIRPTRAIQDGADVVGTAALVPATYHLGKGQLLQIDQAEELSGSIVTSNKPTSVFGGHEAMNLPSTRQARDFALQQLPPYEQWGSEYVAVGYRPRLGDEHEPMPYRIVAARDGTQLDYDPAVPPGAPLTMSAGEVATFWGATGDAFVVRTQDVDHPIYVAAYMTSAGDAIIGQDFLGKKNFAGN